jgi:hypothetical protein
MPVPHDRPTFDQIMYALRTNGEAGDILCTHAAEEIERLTLTDAERTAIRHAEARLRTAYVPDDETAKTLRNLLERTR